MRMGYGLTLEQTQKLIMTPELRQAIVILQLSTLELAEYLQQAVLENPVLEIKDEMQEDEEASDGAVEDKFDLDWQEYFEDGSDLGYVPQPREEKDEFSYEHFLTQAPTLHDHLMFQLHLSRVPEKIRRLGEFLIGNIDEEGYLQTSTEEVARHFNTSEAEVEEALKLVQGFDPPGVGARNLIECLLIQLKDLGHYQPEAEKIIKFYLKDLAEGRINKIAQELEVSPRKIQEIADQIKQLDPKPGRKFGSPNDVRYVIPDVVIEKVGGEFVVLVNDTLTPRLGINPVYKNLLQAGASCDDTTRKFLERRLNSAVWIIRSIEQRRLTLYRVVNCIVEFQREFLEKGIKYLKPLNLRQVAEVLGMHESTVSRATANKYVQTPQGVFELKFFFASGLESMAGNSISAESIKRTIRELIEKEDPRRPLTDQEIAKILAQQGIKIARRTVAKYRDELGILSALKRKRY
ncbi:RNA polymerase factor sigma-54 [Calderihabitans maritimus]|uniref:Sigma-54 RpoN n=1 Tax=Calderihabitans maritimus TaxID=1246530 RepID=A0A1Z5HUH2_9FIRM|nr:RNA polymerase factor sigma-54 [Calderihabitans maritimus]GAW93189.1 sigma-54 RpoN [Calderihabitans maritimus]